MRVDLANGNCNFCPSRSNDILLQICCYFILFFCSTKVCVGGGAPPAPPPARSLTMQILNFKQAGYGLLQQAIFVGGGRGGPLVSALSKKELNYLFKCNLLPAEDKLQLNPANSNPQGKRKIVRISGGSN